MLSLLALPSELALSTQVVYVWIELQFYTLLFVSAKQQILPRFWYTLRAESFAFLVILAKIYPSQNSLGSRFMKIKLKKKLKFHVFHVFFSLNKICRYKAAITNMLCLCCRLALSHYFLENPTRSVREIRKKVFFRKKPIKFHSAK